VCEGPSAAEVALLASAGKAAESLPADLGAALKAGKVGRECSATLCIGRPVALPFGVAALCSLMHKYLDKIFAAQFLPQPPVQAPGMSYPSST
jgi:hypothetical protein